MFNRLVKARNGEAEVRKIVAECKRCQKCYFKSTYNWCNYLSVTRDVRGEPVTERCSKFMTIEDGKEKHGKWYSDNVEDDDYEA